MKFITFIFLIIVFYLSACGLYSSDPSAIFSSDSNSSDVGDGEIPRLSSRSESRPDLDDQPCEDSAACRLVCRAMYDDVDSEAECEELNYGKVEDIEEVFLALLSGEDGGDADPNLEDINFSDLKEYFNIGWDGWIEVVLPTLLRDDIKKVFALLKWVGDSSVATTLMNIKQDTKFGSNAILKNLFLNYCHVQSDGLCENSTLIKNIAIFDVPVATDATHTYSIDFDYTRGGLLCRTGNKATPVIYGGNIRIASITDPDNRKLFASLSASHLLNETDYQYSSNVKDFFRYVADNNSRTDAFTLAHQLLEEACETSAGTSSDEFEQCIRGFYCWINANESGTIVRPDNIDEINSRLNIKRQGGGLDCACTNFKEI